LEWLETFRNIIYIVAFFLNLLFMGVGFYVHYRVTETRNDEREKRTNEILNHHNKRLESLESNNMQQNGQTTYIPRPECDRKHRYLEDLILKKSTP